MENIIRLTVAVALSKLADVIDVCTQAGATVTLQAGDVNPDAAHEADVDRQVAQANRKRGTVSVAELGRKLAASVNGAVKHARPGNPALTGKRTVYAVVGTKRAQETAAENLVGAKQIVFRTIMHNPGKMGMADLQRKLASRVPPKTVDGSIYALRQMGVIESKSIDA